MSELDTEIEALESTLARLKELKSQEENKTKKWEPVGGKYLIMSNGESAEVTQTSINLTMATLFGRRRQTEEQAESASIEMRRFNRLLALRDELCADGAVNWRDNQEEKHYVYLNHVYKKWCEGTNYNNENIQVYFTTRELAQQACDMLNSGAVIL